MTRKSYARTVESALDQRGDAPHAIGIANQGETVVAWDADDQAPDPQRHRLAGCRAPPT
jgi:glycerol kinase